MTPQLYHRRLARTLERMGGLYTTADIIKAISERRMQSFVDGDSWVVTQVADFPRTRMLEVLAAVGNLAECRRLHDRVLQYARDNDIGLVQAYGRRGWVADAAAHGWKVKTTSYLYQRDM